MPHDEQTDTSEPAAPPAQPELHDDERPECPAWSAFPFWAWSDRGAEA